MSGVNESIVREYFESLGFFVLQPCKYQVVARAKLAPESIDLLALHPTRKECVMPKKGVWSGRELNQIGRAVVGICGWHTESISPAVLESSPELYRFASAEVDPYVQRSFGGEALPVAKVLCLPALPASAELRARAVESICGKGVDGILPYRTILRELLDSLDTQKLYDKSEVLQTLRILKNYELLRDAQMELFGVRRRARSRAARSAEKLPEDTGS
jgi:hypothetical protein